jgi:hypothetical protein
VTKNQYLKKYFGWDAESGRATACHYTEFEVRVTEPGAESKVGRPSSLGWIEVSSTEGSSDDSLLGPATPPLGSSSRESRETGSDTKVLTFQKKHGSFSIHVRRAHAMGYTHVRIRGPSSTEYVVPIFRGRASNNSERNRRIQHVLAALPASRRNYSTVALCCGISTAYARLHFRRG